MLCRLHDDVVFEDVVFCPKVKLSNKTRLFCYKFSEASILAVRGNEKLTMGDIHTYTSEQLGQN